MLGAQVDGPEARSFNGLDVQLWPRVSWSPLFALTLADVQVRLRPAGQLWLMPMVAMLVPSLDSCSSDIWTSISARNTITSSFVLCSAS